MKSANNGDANGVGVGVVGENGIAKGRKYYCAMDYPLNFRMHVWNRIWLGTAHFFGIQGVIMLVFGWIPRSTLILSFFFGYFAGAGITVGCHRYWAHRTFKAKLPLQIILAYAQTMASQYPIFKWCRDHRVHHKYTETAADPHNARRGFWFAHIGWLLTETDPALKEKEATLDLSDLDNDPVVRFQTKYYWPLLVLSVYIVPISILQYFYPSLTLYQLICLNYVWYMFSLHITFLVNSAAHLWGLKPYDTGIFASENPLVSLLAVGEGYHNYHHVFPWDYKTSELGMYGRNWSSLFIDTFAYLGLAYDLKTVPYDVVMKRVHRTGDATLHEDYTGKKNPSNRNNNLEDKDEDKQKKLPVWGWGDEDIPDNHFQITQTLFSRESSKAA